MGRITINELSNSLTEYLTTLGLKEDEVIAIVNSVVGSLEGLPTVDKSNIVNALTEINTKIDNIELIASKVTMEDGDTVENAINTLDQQVADLFQSANNGKQLIATAIGEPLSSEDTFQAMSDDIDSLLSDLRSAIGNKGVSVSDEKLQDLIQLVNQIGGDTEAVRLSIIAALSQSIGEPTSVNDSVSEMCDKVDTMTQDFRNQLVSKGVSIDGTEHLAELVERVDDVGWMGETETVHVQEENWSSVQSMTTKRYSLTSSVVNNKIYCIGGYNDSYLTTSECYDPSTNTWSSVQNMTAPRSSLTSSVVNNKIYCIGGFDGSSALKTNQCYDPSTNTWSTKANMTTARRHLISSVVDNKIYCIGGYTDSILSTNECYDPSTDTWSTKKAMTTKRHALTSSVVDNKIYCIGGINGSHLATNECYDPSTNTWATVKSMLIPRSFLTSSVVNNKIYCIGGDDGFSALKTNECYDPSNNTWSSKASMTTARPYLTSSTVDNKIYCIGGYNTSGLYTNECYFPLITEQITHPNTFVPALVNVIGSPTTTEDTVYTIADKLSDTKDKLSNSLESKGLDISGEESLDELVDKVEEIPIVQSTKNLPPWYIPSFEDTWITAKEMPTSRNALTSSVVGNKIYCIGGYNGSALNTNECYDPSTNTWSSKEAMTTARYYLTSSVVNNKIYCIGGRSSVSSTTRLDVNECYDPSTNTWSTVQSMTTKRGALSSSVVDNKIYCIGGYSGSSYLTTHECYDPSTNSWTTKASLSSKKSDFTSSVVDNKIYVIGGYTGSDNRQSRNECYDPSTNSWSTKAAMTTARSALSSSVVDNKIYCIGGADDSSALKTNECYDPSTNSWSTKASMTAARGELISSSVNNQIYVIGGIKSSSRSNINECYIP